MPVIEYSRGECYIMVIKDSRSRKIFIIVNTILIILITFTCIIPIWNLLCMSFSNAAYVSTGEVKLWPKGFTLAAYEFVIKNGRFWTATAVSVKRLLLGLPLNLILCVLIAYPLSKDEYQFKSRKYYTWFFLITMVFNGGLIPTFLVVNSLGIMDTVFALVLPGAVNVFNAILMLNFFRGIPKEIEESASLDGANQYYILFKLYIPLAMPSIATIILFSLIGHWNSWFDGLIYMNFSKNYPLQTYLQTIISGSTSSIMENVDLNEIIKRAQVNSRNLRAAQIFISIIPIMTIYPFLQKYFTSGITLGSVKG